jgi:hypothetical protein
LEFKEIIELRLGVTKTMEEGALEISVLKKERKSLRSTKRPLILLLSLGRKDTNSSAITFSSFSKWYLYSAIHLDQCYCLYVYNLISHSAVQLSQNLKKWKTKIL